MNRDLATAPRGASLAEARAVVPFDLPAASAAVRTAAATDAGLALRLLHRAAIDQALELIGPHLAPKALELIGHPSAWSRPPSPSAQGTDDATLSVVQDGSRTALVGRQNLGLTEDTAGPLLVLTLERGGEGPGRLFLLPVDGHLRDDAPVFDRPAFRPRWIEAPVPLPAEPLALIPSARIATILDQLAIGEELLHAALDLGVLEGFRSAARMHITTRTRPWQGQSLAKATDDPHLLRRWGAFTATFHAAQGLVDEAVATAASGDPAAQADAVGLARGYLLLAGKDLISGTIELLGASATSERYGFDRYWRDFTAHSVIHPPLRPFERIGSNIVAKEGARR